MTWLKPENITDSMYDPETTLKSVVDWTEPEWRVVFFIVLEVWNEVNPLNTYYGDDCNPDEYAGHAERFIKGLRAELITWEVQPKQTSPFILVELVRRSFHSSQVCYNPALKRCWVTRSTRVRLARHIAAAFRRSKVEFPGCPW